MQNQLSRSEIAVMGRERLLLLGVSSNENIGIRDGTKARVEGYV